MNDPITRTLKVVSRTHHDTTNGEKFQVFLAGDDGCTGSLDVTKEQFDALQLGSEATLHLKGAGTLDAEKRPDPKV